MSNPTINLAAACLLVAAGTVNAETDNEVGKQVYETTCARCHDSGTMGAPVLDDMEEWTDRTQLLWSDVHSQHLEDGFLKTAEKDKKKGVTAEQMEAATNYMVSIVTPK